jgi:hypothetical protein
VLVIEERDTKRAPAPGLETRTLTLLHEFGTLQTEVVAQALAVTVQEANEALGALFTAGLVARGGRGYRSLGVWHPGHPALDRPAL